MQLYNRMKVCLMNVRVNAYGLFSEYPFLNTDYFKGPLSNNIHGYSIAQYSTLIVQHFTIK